MCTENEAHSVLAIKKYLREDLKGFMVYVHQAGQLGQGHGQGLGSWSRARERDQQFLASLSPSGGGAGGKGTNSAVAFVWN